ncbi:protein kinase [bacterium]|nr:protein kinase [bacterium]
MNTSRDPESRDLNSFGDEEVSASSLDGSRDNWFQDFSSGQQDEFEAEGSLARSHASSRDPLIGKILFGTYKIESIIGEGAMGIVYKARHLAFDRFVAMKTLKTDDPVLWQRFAREVKTHARLKHENIVEAVDCLVAPGNRTFFVMEYLDGVPLEDLIKNGELVKMPIEFGLIVKQILAALSYAHNEGVVHRDIKPGNIVLTKRDGKYCVKMVDFGIARLQEDGQRLTRTGQALGSPLYMSPEQCMGNDLDGRADLYSLGVLIYECLTGTFPFLGRDMVSTMALHCDPDKTPLPLKERIPDFPCVEQLDSIIAKSLQTYPENRYRDGSEFNLAMDFWLESVKNNTPALSVPGTSRRAGKATVIDKSSYESQRIGSSRKKSITESAINSSSRKEISQPGLPPKKSKAGFGPAIIAGVIFGLLLSIAGLVVTLFVMKDRMAQMTQSMDPAPSKTRQVKEINAVTLDKPAPAPLPKSGGANDKKDRRYEAGIIKHSTGTKKDSTKGKSRSVSSVRPSRKVSPGIKTRPSRPMKTDKHSVDRFDLIRNQRTFN